MKKRLLPMLLVLVMLLGLLAGCAGKTDPAPSTDPQASDSQTPESTPSGEKTKITFMGWGTDAEVATFTEMIKQFEAKYQDVEVEYIVVPDNEFDTKLQAMIGGGSCPDVFYCNIDKMMKYAATGNLLNLTAYYENNEIFEQGNVWECLLDLYRFDGENQGSGNIYAMPKDVSAFPIFYNKDLFKAAGVTPPTADDPWDWNDFLEAAKKLTSGEGDNKIRDFIKPYNDGWEHTCGDLLTIHDYSSSGDVLKKHFESMESILAMTPGGRNLFADGYHYLGQPILVTEFGGVKYASESAAKRSWGYCEENDLAAYTRKYAELTKALQDAPLLQGYCYTQLTDVETEENGLLTYHRDVKIPLDTIRKINEGTWEG